MLTLTYKVLMAKSKVPINLELASATLNNPILEQPVLENKVLIDTQSKMLGDLGCIL